MNQPSLIRDIVGFFIGGVSAAVAAGLVFVAFFPLPTENDPRNHVGRTFVMLAVVMFLCGGFIGRRGFSAEALSDLLPSIIGTYAVAGLLPLFSGLSLSEIAPLIGFASVGVLASATVSLLLWRRFPPKEPTPEV